ncbi:flagellar basal body L-ring protein FlgH [Pseudooceanicola onchidii]|uniref:flagellar basal body L-ring protein FlgH n=1 Tax=Pseudooceanicola onchidii TaxID=2562279 RepID=UPI0010AB0D1E|nr:flagellar basal body L-ring protein FlgH [Pseudooceanicola onchidii]
MRRLTLVALSLSLLTACGRQDHLGKEPSFTPSMKSLEHAAMMDPGLPFSTEKEPLVHSASLWNNHPQSLLGDRRAMRRGDILTVVVEIDDKAEISNSTSRSRSGSESLSVPQLFGIPQIVDRVLPEGATSANAVELGSSSDASGDGSVRRNEKLTLRIAATIVEVLPNGVLHIEGAQEVRVNFELRELVLSGYVRPEDISRQNEITYDKIAQAKVSYGGRGQITDMQQPRIGQQVVDAVLPF